MQIKLNYIILSIFIILLISISCKDSSGVTENPENQFSIVNKYGQLSIDGSNLVDKNGEVIALRGMSLFWSQWAPDYYSESTIKWLRDDWKCTVIRAAMGIENGGYLENPEQEKMKIKRVIDICIKLGIYVIVDWHDHHGEDHLEEAKKFFKSISQEYGENENIIYEIYNEPLNVSWTNVLKPYAEAVISEIRKNDPDNIIVVGTPNWSQDVDKVINNRIDDENVAYSLHFYTGTHQQWLRDKANLALAAGIPLFVTEWGLSEANAGGDIDIIETNKWRYYMDVTNLSWCNWSVTNKDETSSILHPTTSKLSGWSEDELSEAGKIMKDYLVDKNSGMFE